MWKKLSGSFDEARLLRGKYGHNVLFKDRMGRTYIATRIVPGKKETFVKVREHGHNKRKEIEEKMLLQAWYGRG
jgi:hypothetical protein